MSRQRDPVERLLRARLEQGFPHRCTDPVVMARIAAIIGLDFPNKRSPTELARVLPPGVCNRHSRGPGRASS